jgi:hypothetical protein
MPIKGGICLIKNKIMETLFEITPKPILKPKFQTREENGRFCTKGTAEAKFWKLRYEKRENYVRYLESMVSGLSSQLKNR